MQYDPTYLLSQFIVAINNATIKFFIHTAQASHIHLYAYQRSSDSPVSNIVISTHKHIDTQEENLISEWTSFITLTNRQSSKVPFIYMQVHQPMNECPSRFRSMEVMDKKDRSFIPRPKSREISLDQNTSTWCSWDE